MVVDDNPLSRAVAEGHLVDSGYSVVSAEDGTSALECFTREQPDLVILDILMPGIDGYETCRRLRGLEGGDSTPIVFLTSLDDFVANDRALESGADDFLTKPIKRTELLLRVRSLIRVKQLMVELRESLDVIRSQHASLLKMQDQKEELTSLIVHDLKNPLSGILMNASLLMRQKELSEPARRFSARISRAAEGVNRMVLDLLDVSRGEDGQLLPRISGVDLEALISEVTSGTAAQAEEKGQRIETDINLSDPVIQTDPDLLRRVLVNLVDNGLKYSPGDGTVRIQVCQGQRPDRLELSVRDEGPGIPREHRDKVFQKYVRLDRDAEQDARTSRGLGLVFCRMAVEACGGHIDVEDNQPRGSCFRLDLPRQFGAGSPGPREDTP